MALSATLLFPIARDDELSKLISKGPCINTAGRPEDRPGGGLRVSSYLVISRWPNPTIRHNLFYQADTTLTLNFKSLIFQNWNPVIGFVLESLNSVRSVFLSFVCVSIAADFRLRKAGSEFWWRNLKREQLTEWWVGGVDWPLSSFCLVSGGWIWSEVEDFRRCDIDNDALGN